MTETLSAPQALAPATGPTPQKLKRSIGVVGGTLLTLSCVTPASTLFVVVPDLFSSLGTYTALTIAIGSLLCIAVAFCYSELGTLIPSAGASTPWCRPWRGGSPDGSSSCSRCWW